MKRVILKFCLKLTAAEQHYQTYLYTKKIFLTSTSWFVKTVHSKIFLFKITDIVTPQINPYWIRALTPVCIIIMTMNMNKNCINNFFYFIIISGISACAIFCKSYPKYWKSQYILITPITMGRWDTFRDVFHRFVNGRGNKRILLLPVFYYEIRKKWVVGQKYERGALQCSKRVEVYNVKKPLLWLNTWLYVYKLSQLFLNSSYSLLLYFYPLKKFFL